MKRFYVWFVHDSTGGPLAEVFAEDALAALTIYARDHGYAGYARDGESYADDVSVDLPEDAVAVYENTEIRARRA